MKKFLFLISLTFLVGCTGPVYQAEIDEVKNICDTNEGVFKYHVNTWNVNPIYEIVCNDGAMFNRAQTITTLEKRKDKENNNEH